MWLCLPSHQVLCDVQRVTWELWELQLHLTRLLTMQPDAWQPSSSEIAHVVQPDTRGAPTTTKHTHTNSHVMSWQVLWLKSIMKSCLKLTRSEHGLFNGHGSTVSTRNWANAQNMRFSGLCWRGWVTLRLTIRLKGYIYRQHLHTVT